MIIPALNMATNMSPHAISATSLFCVSIASLTGASSYLEQGFTNIPIALTLMVTSIPGSAIGARLASSVSGKMLKRISGVAMLVSAPGIYLKADKLRGGEGQDGDSERELDRLRWKNRLDLDHISKVKITDVTDFVGKHLDFIALGLVTGVASGMIGIGGGLVMNTYMGLCTDMLQHEVIATSLLVAVPIGVSGSLVHFRAGRINLMSCGLIAGSATVAMGAASRCLSGIDDTQLKKIFAALLVGSAFTMIR